MIVAGLVGALLAAIITVIALNFVAGEKQIQRKLEHRYTVDDPQFRRELGILLGPAIIDGNRVTNLENGDEIFPAMLDAVKAARHNITFETYIYWSGDIGRTFAEALAERARAGVEVHVLIDWVGSQKMEQALLDLMDEAGVQVERYHPLHWYHLGAHEQPHPPQAADRGRRGRLHRRRRHRRPVGRRRAASPITGAIRTTASRGRRSRRCRRRSWTTGSRPPARCCRARSTSRR